MAERRAFENQVHPEYEGTLVVVAEDPENFKLEETLEKAVAIAKNGHRNTGKL